jgi:DNA-binding phage protein
MECLFGGVRPRQHSCPTNKDTQSFRSSENLTNLDEFITINNNEFITLYYTNFKSQMLLLLLLLLSEKNEQNRVLIDALLHVNWRSVASVAREAGVEPANLSRLRKPEGNDQVSEAGQLRLLKAIRWTGGTPDSDQVHHWRIRNDDGLQALDWLLRVKLNGNAKLHQIVVRNEPQVTDASQAWVGDLTNSGAYCLIFLTGVAAAKGQFPSAMKTIAKLGAVTEVSKSDWHALELGKLYQYELRMLTESGHNDAPENDQLQLLTQLTQLGLSKNQHLQLLKNWLANQAIAAPDELQSKLAELEKLSLGDETFMPKAMTERQRHRLVSQLALGQKLSQ